MKATNSIIKEVINRVTVAVTKTDTSRFTLAKELYWAQHVVNWRLTSYSSWTKFCKNHILMGKSTVDRYTTTINIIKVFKYTDDQCIAMITGVGWTSFVDGLIDLHRKIPVKQFILKYKGFNSANGSKARCKAGGDRSYSFSLPVKQADKLDVYLHAYGMSSNDHYRRGVRQAMITLINKKLV